ncbi:MAG: OmpA family protein [Pyrinomonadaceae bacterium]|nr:OmpA family protein [Phycisphaerales bacterium]
MSDEHDKHDEGHGKGGGGHGGGHGSGPPHGGGSHEEHEGAPEWLISFADNVALMMGFFVILLAMNMSKPDVGGMGGVDKNPATEPTQQMLDFVLAMREAFNTPIDMNGSNPNEAKLRKRLQEQKKQADTKDEGPKGDHQTVQAIKTSDYVAPTGIIPFELGSSVVSSSGVDTVAGVAEQIRGRRVIIEVRGHVSSAEVVKDAQRGMQLAHDRSLAIANLLVEHGVKWNQLRLVGCADSSPVQARADTPMEHRTNQRVEVVVTKEPLAPDQFSGDQGAGAAPRGGKE